VAFVVEYPRGRAEHSLGEELDEFLEKELDVRIYGRYIDLSSLQAKIQCLTVMQERIMELKKESKEQDELFTKLKKQDEKNKKEEEEIRRKFRNIK